jgi:hypothetical protein
MFKKGDRVIYKTDPRKLRATVVDVTVTSHWTFTHNVQVEFDSPSVIPRRMQLRDTDLELLGDEFHYQATDMRECQCGLKFIREGGMHSIWCPMYRS